MVDVDLSMHEWVETAKKAFKYYAISHKTKMTYIEFNTFIQDFLKDEPELLNKFNVKTAFAEFAETNKGFLEEKEFEDAWKDIKISRMKTKDQIEL